MKVTMVHSEWFPVPPVLGGPISQTLFETAVSIRDPVVTVISPWSDALKGLEVSPAGIFYHVDVDAQAEKVKQVLGDRLPPGLRTGVAARRFNYLNGVTDLLLDLNPDVIQVHNRPEHVPYLVKQFPDKQMVLYMHNRLRSSVVNLEETIQELDRLVFVSRHMAQQVISRYPKSESKITVIYNSVDTDLWHPGLKESEETEKIRRDYGLSPGRTVVFVGRTIVQKGISFLLEAMEIVRERLPGVKLLVVGSPVYGARQSDPFTRKLKKRASQMADTVTFTGYIDRDKTPYFYAAADVTVVPSVWDEPFGKVVIESMATGVPVIGSRRGGIPEIIDHRIDGILVNNPENVNSLAKHIVDLLEDPGCLKEMGTKARLKAVEKFATSIRLERVRSFYRFLEKRIRPGSNHQDIRLHNV